MKIIDSLKCKIKNKEKIKKLKSKTKSVLCKKDDKLLLKQIFKEKDIEIIILNVIENLDIVNLYKVFGLFNLSNEEIIKPLLNSSDVNKIVKLMGYLKIKINESFIELLDKSKTEDKLINEILKEKSLVKSEMDLLEDYILKKYDNNDLTLEQIKKYINSLSENSIMYKLKNLAKKFLNDAEFQEFLLEHSRCLSNDDFINLVINIKENFGISKLVYYLEKEIKKGSNKNSRVYFIISKELLKKENKRVISDYLLKKDIHNKNIIKGNKIKSCKVKKELIEKIELERYKKYAEFIKTKNNKVRVRSF